MYYGVGGNSPTDMPLDYLEHHGILGQKWGVRRFQNKDGTRTEAGKKREQEGSSGSAQNGGTKKGISKETIKKAAVIGAGVAVGAALIANPVTRNALAKYGKTTLSNLKDVNKAKALGTKIGTSIGRRAGNGVNRASEAAINTILASVGGIAISKISSKLQTNENDSEFKKTKNKVILEATSAGVKAALGSDGNGNNNKGSSNAKVDKSSAEYQNLFSGLESREDRQKIKDRANSGASMEELQRLREELGHSEVHEWIDSIISDPARW